MEWTKENTVNTFIRCASKKKTERAIQFYKELGYTVYPGEVKHRGIVHATPRYNAMTSYLGSPEGCKEIKPFYKPSRKFPREMMVSNDKINWCKQKVFGKLTSTIKPYLTCFPSGYNYKGWKYAKEIE